MEIMAQQLVYSKAVAAPKHHKTSVVDMHISKCRLFCFASVGMVTAALVAGCGGGNDNPTTEPRHLEGVLSSGGRYVIDVPANWNGSLYVYSPGYISSPLPAGQAPRNATDDVTKAWLLEQGYALAGSQPVGIGWAVAEVMPDQAELVQRVVPANIGTPRRTIAWCRRR